MKIETSEAELNILRHFFKAVSESSIQDNSISDSKIVRETKNKLKVALRDWPFKCSCSKRKYDMCEVCQGSSSEVYYLRIFYRMISKAKQNNMTSLEIQNYIQNTKNSLNPVEKKTSRNRKT